MFVQTSTHEGFCLPPLESMATGGAVVCTDAHGNRDFCDDGENCLIPEPDRARGRRRHRPAARTTRRCASGSGARGFETAADYAWPKRIDALEAFLERDRRRHARIAAVDGCRSRASAAPRPADRTAQPDARKLRPGVPALPRLPARADAALHADESDAREVRDGRAALQRVRRDVPGAARRRPADARAARARRPRGRRARALRRVHARRAAGTGSTIRRLPDDRRRLLVRAGRPRSSSCGDTIAFRPGQWLLDVGSNTCWASNWFARPRAAGDRARHLAVGDAGPVHGRLLHRGRHLVLRAGARVDERHADRVGLARLRVLPARSCTTTTATGCGGRSRRPTGCSSPAAGCWSSTRR